MHAGPIVASNIRLPEEVCLRGPDGSVAIVIQNEKLNGQLVAGDRGQFLDIELESAIPIHANCPPFIIRKTDPNACWNPKAHGAESGGLEDALPFFGGVGKMKVFETRSRAARDNIVIILNHACQHFRKMKDAHRTGFPVLRLNQGIAFLPIATTLDPSLTIPGHDRRTLTLEFVEKRGCVRVYSGVDQAAQLSDLRLVHIDHHLVRPSGELGGLPTGQREIHSCADDEKEIAVLQREVRATRGQRSGAANEQRIVFRYKIRTDPGGLHWDPQPG